MKRLVSSWVDAQRTSSGKPLASAIKELSRECGITLNHSRVAEWRKGKYTPSQKVISQMLYDVLPWAIKKAGIKATDEQLAALDEKLWNFTTIEGQRQIEHL